MMIDSVVVTQYVNVTATQTDRQTYSHVAIASGGKNRIGLDKVGADFKAESFRDIIYEFRLQTLSCREIKLIECYLRLRKLDGKVVTDVHFAVKMLWSGESR